MRNYLLLLLAHVFASVTITAQQGANPIYCSPSVLYIGKGPVEIRISTTGIPPIGMMGQWNGSLRPARPDSSFGYLMELTADDVARPGLYEVSLTAKNGEIFGSTWLPVVYDIQPGGARVDRARNRAYLSTPAMPGDSRFPANSVVALDPDTGITGPSVQVGRGAGDLVLSDDGNSLYAVVESEGLVRRIDLDTFSIVSEFRFREATTNATSYSRTAIAVMPGRPQTVALFWHPDVGNSFARIALFDNGIKRPGEIDPGYGFDGMLISPDGEYLFLGSYKTVNGPRSTVRYSIEQTGFLKQTAVSARGGSPVEIKDGRLYTSHGSVIDWETMQVTALLPVGGAIAVDLPRERILVAYDDTTANSSDYPVYLQAFDLPTQQPLGRLTIGRINYFGAGSSPAVRLFRFGTDGIVYTAPYGLLILHTPLARSAPRTEAGAIVNAAGQVAGPIAPGEILSIYGQNLGPSTAQTAVPSASGGYGAVLGGIQVWFNSIPGTLLLASENQLNVIAPFGLQPGTNVDFQIWNFGIPSAKVSLPVASAAPALFTRDGGGGGPAAVVNQDGTVNTSSPAGSVITLYGTGGGVVPGALDGGIARGAQSLAGPVRVVLDGLDIPVLYSGAAPTLPYGVFQINAQIPAGRKAGIFSVSVFVNGIESPKGVTLAIR